MEEQKSSSREGKRPELSSISMVTFDVDGTIFRKPCLRHAAHRLGLGEKWDQLDEVHDKGRISLQERLVSHYKLLNGLPLADVMREVASVEVMKSIRETVEKLQGQRIRTAMLSDLPDFVCGYLVERFGFEGFVASKVGIKDGMIDRGIEPLADKRLGLRKYSAWTGIPLSRCVHIGDGLNDVPVFRIVRYSIALNSKLSKVNALASHLMATDDMMDVYRFLAST